MVSSAPLPPPPPYTRTHTSKLAAPFTKAASSLFHCAGRALLVCGNASRGNENTGKSLQLFLESNAAKRDGPCSCKITHTHATTYMYAKCPCRWRAQVTLCRRLCPKVHKHRCVVTGLSRHRRSKRKPTVTVQNLKLGLMLSWLPQNYRQRHCESSHHC